MFFIGHFLTTIFREIKMRSYIRHPSNMPIEFVSENSELTGTQQMKNVGEGGLSFITEYELKKGMVLTIKIPNLKNELNEKCVVVWCKKSGAHYHIGVKFLNKQSTFRVRMVEQICYIENYRNEILEKEGRNLTAKEASGEWIKKFATKFPKI